MFKVSQSKINTWNTCGFKYHMRYVEKLRKIKKARPLLFGSIIHEMDEAAAAGDDPFKVLDLWYKNNKKMFAEEVAYYGNIIEDIRVLYTEYMITHPEKSLMPVRINKKNAEHDFEVPITKNILFIGKIDRVVKWKGDRWLYERKTFSKFPDEDTRWRSVQSASYIACMAIMEWPPVAGTLWDYFRSKPPSEPQFKKDGTLSNRECDTLPTKLKQYAKENNIKPAAIAPLMKKAEERRKQYFPRVHTIIKPRVVNTIMQDVIVTATDMAKRHGVRKERNIGQHCGWCDYELLCRAELQGLDVKTIKERNYRREEYKKPEVEVSTE